MYRLPRRMLEQTFATFRSCGAGERECKLYWVSSWDDRAHLTEVIHPRHSSNRYGVTLDSDWINALWLDLASRGLGVRVQVHTHPGEAFHSDTDDAFPLIHEAGFLSVVIPDFAKGPVGFSSTYLTEIQSDGSWCEVPVGERLLIHG